MICSWIFELFPLFGNYEWCCCEHSCTSVCVDIHFHFSRPSGSIAGSHDASMFSFMRNFQTVFHSSGPIWYFHQQCMCSNSCTSSPTLLCLFDSSHTSGCEVLSHCVLICISLMANDIFSWAHRPFVHLLWSNVYSDFLPLLKLGFIIIIKFQEFFTYSRHVSYQISDMQIFSPILYIVFSFSQRCSLKHKRLSSDDV